jgi:hypothetical protein
MNKQTARQILDDDDFYDHVDDEDGGDEDLSYEIDEIEINEEYDDDEDNITVDDTDEDSGDETFTAPTVPIVSRTIVRSETIDMIDSSNQILGLFLYNPIVNYFS